MAVDPAWLIVVGLILSLLGAVLLAVEAIGASELVAQLTRPTSPHRARLTELWLTSTVNRSFVILLMWGTGFLILWAALRQLAAALLLSVAVYPAWASMRWIVRRGLRATSRGGCFWALAKVVITLPHLLTLLIEMGFRAVSELLIRPVTLVILRRVARRVDVERPWGLRSYAFYGILLLAVGFIYQLIGTLLQIRAAH